MKKLSNSQRKWAIMNKSEGLFYTIWCLCVEDLRSSVMHYSPITDIWVGGIHYSRWNNGISPENDLNLKLLNEDGAK